MTKIRSLFAALSAAFLILPVFGQAVEYPARRGFVNDFAGVLNAQQENFLLTKIRGIANQGAEFIVVTVPSLEGKSVEQYTIGLARAWKIGGERGDGAVFLIAVKDRKVRIEVGKSLAARLPSSTVQTIIDQKIIPSIRANGPDGGLVTGITEIASVLNATDVVVKTIPAPVSSAAPVQQPVTETSFSVSWEEISNTLQEYLPTIIFVLMVAAIGFMLFRMYRRAKAKERVETILREYPNRVRKLRASVISPASEANSLINTAEQQYNKVRQRSYQMHQGEFTWLQLLQVLEDIGHTMRKAESIIAKDKKMEAEARESVPKLLSELPEKIEQLKQKTEGTKWNAAALKAENLYTQAREAHDSGSTDWLMIYLLLSSANNFHDDTHHSVSRAMDVPAYSRSTDYTPASTTTPFVDDDLLSSSPSSSDFGSSSSDFGGGSDSGGSFGGDGGSGSW